jgi:thiol-disulfide isomerase/thioredoxin
MAFGGMMRNLLYTCLVLAANAAGAGVVDEALLTGDMAKLAIVEARSVSAAAMTDRADQTQSLEALRGRWVVLNFWATWCAPCREEMPSLDRLQQAMPQVTVLGVATGPNPVPAMDRFLEEAGVATMTIWRDPQSAVAREMAVLGLPVTVIVSPEGVEVARLIGGAEWDSPEAQAVLAALMQ